VGHPDFIADDEHGLGEVEGGVFGGCGNGEDNVAQVQFLVGQTAIFAAEHEAQLRFFRVALQV